MSSAAVREPSAWEHYTLRQGGRLRAFIEFDRQAAFELQHSGDAYGFRIVLYLDETLCDEAGMPGPEGKALLAQRSAAAIQYLNETGIECRLVARLTLAAMQELVFQAAEYKPFWVQMTAWLRESGWEGEVRKYEGWTFFDEYIIPDATMLQQISDRRQLEALWAQGYAQGEPHPLLFSFSGPAEAHAIMRQELAHDGFSVVTAADTSQVLRRLVPLAEHELYRLTMALEAFSQEVGVKYEGWRAEGNPAN